MFRTLSCYPVSQGEIKSDSGCWMTGPCPSATLDRTVQRCSVLDNLYFNPRGPGAVLQCDKPFQLTTGSWQHQGCWSKCPDPGYPHMLLSIPSRDLFSVTVMWIALRPLLELQPTSPGVLTDASVFFSASERRLWRQFPYLCLFCFGNLCSRVSRGVCPLSSFPAVSLLPSLCHSQLLVGLSDFLLSWSIHHLSSVVHTPFSSTSLSLVSLVSLSGFSPLVSELLSLIPSLHLPPFIVLLSVILAKSTFIGEEYPHGNAADGDFWLAWLLFFFPPTAKSQSVFEIKSGCDSISCSGEGTREKQDWSITAGARM